MRKARCSIGRLRLIFTGLFVLSIFVTWFFSPTYQPQRRTQAAKFTVAIQSHPKLDEQALANAKQLRGVANSAANGRSATTTSIPSTTITVMNDVPDVFYARIIGNALPPRHDPKRTLQNLKFVLENEFHDPRVKKHWVLNRILDPNVEQQLIDLLELHQASYSRIPFDVKEYSHAHFDLFDQDDGHDHIHSRSKLDQWGTSLLMSDIYDSKNLYAMSINHARNIMIELGISLGARWIFPWDENCFLTQESWNIIARDLMTNDGDHKYFVSWMDRLKEENPIVLTSAYKPDPWEEPQVIFRSDSKERFDEDFRYGRRDKAGLLIRLNVPGAWFQWGWTKWERKRTFDKMSTDFTMKIPSTGYVVRLFSGKALYEDKSYAFHREMARADAVSYMLESLEARVMRESLHYRSSELLIYCSEKIEQLRQTKNSALLDQIASNADDSLHSPIPDTQAFAINKLHNNYRNDPNMYHELQRQFDNMVYNTTALVFGWIMKNEPKYLHHTQRILHSWFIQGENSITPSPGFQLDLQEGILVTQTLLLLTESLKLLKEYSDDPQTAGTVIHVENWLRSFFNNLKLDSKQKEKSRWFRDHEYPLIGRILIQWTKGNLLKLY
ncbi:Aste57867_24759 [Aphanomyces stellatus]|uniref:Aste57867_24759 protein n=1 Tax=Aphanomyces stellatus TaxID=120398 RepID=A0A485LRY4_9STRA|nr:hypothetical protein As57867_024681 [Aphanomyces stellatus]VFU01395.1 Aste57867_24759 [Aphanomyces stellatus]